ncbi:hypothetical protein BS78_01G110000 [Paspalum vaginatum]|nr:hypothetical protein BS78_01G110000 [Paspalum vaginatum]
MVYPLHSIERERERERESAIGGTGSMLSSSSCLLVSRSIDPPRPAGRLGNWVRNLQFDPTGDGDRSSWMMKYTDTFLPLRCNLRVIPLQFAYIAGYMSNKSHMSLSCWPVPVDFFLAS